MFLSFARRSLWASARRGLGFRTIATTTDIATKTLPQINRRQPRQSEGAEESWVDSESDQQYSLRWQGTGPKTVLLVKKSDSAAVDSAMVSITRWLHATYPQINIVLEPLVFTQYAGQLPFIRTIAVGDHLEYSRVVDFVITLGGDGTFLHVSSLFQREVPPIVPFSMGTLGFLLPFNVADFQPQLRNVIEGTSTVLPRMRLTYAKRLGDGS
ncbi:NADH kinase pos5, partial [Coemansia sp. RSA 2673]